MTPPVAVYDACVLYPAPLRDLLVRAALAGLVRAHWSDQIHDEWTRNLLANRPELSATSIERCRRLMDLHLPEALVTGYESLVPTLTLPDADDRHVLAAAVHAGATLIVTFNLADFPPSQLAPHGSRPSIRTSSWCGWRTTTPRRCARPCGGSGSPSRSRPRRSKSFCQSWPSAGFPGRWPRCD